MWEIFENLCKERGVTPYRVCEATGIKTSSMTAWKQGRYKFKAEKLMLIADYFGVSLEYLMTGKQPEGYYLNPETAEIAQEIFDNKGLRTLFDAVRDASPKELEAIKNLYLAMKTDYDGDEPA